MIKSMKEDILGLIQTLEEFGVLLQAETQALKVIDIQTVDTLQARKHAMAKEYQQKIEALALRKAEMATVDVSLREHMQKTRNIFSFIVTDNLRALENTKNSARRLADRILEATRRTVGGERQTSYSSKGSHYTAPSAMLSMRVDQSL